MYTTPTTRNGGSTSTETSLQYIVPSTHATEDTDLYTVLKNKSVPSIHTSPNTNKGSDHVYTVPTTRNKADTQ